MLSISVKEFLFWKKKQLSKGGDQQMIEVERIWLGAYASLLGDVALQELCFGGLWISGVTAS